LKNLRDMGGPQGKKKLRKKRGWEKVGRKSGGHAERKEKTIVEKHLHKKGRRGKKKRGGKKGV